MNKRKVFVFAFIALLSFILIHGCEKDPLIVSYGEPAIFAELVRNEHGDETKNLINISVGGTRLIPVVTLNNDTLELDSYRRNEISYYSRFRGNVSVAPGDECNLIVYHNQGQASATINLPGDFEITSPGEDDTLHQDEDLDVAWSTSEGAERYKSDFSLYYSYIDTAGALNTYRLDTTFYTTTGFAIPKEKIFPPEVDSVEYGSGSIYVYSEAGPCIGHTTKGNISGEGVGYFTAYNQLTQRIYFSLEESPFIPIDSVIEVSPTEQFETRLEYLNTCDSNFIE